MKQNLSTLRAFTLTELMVVLVIIGILMLIALPIFDDLFGEAYSIEAQNQLKYIQSRQQTYYQKNFRYSGDFQELGFTAPKTLDEEGEARYTYDVVDAGKSSFLARATAIADFDKDGNVNIWEINQEGKLTEVTPD
ncbi:MAG: prepilin-type N-terminal cleavage/methylation domain-containing protein [Saprospiraceae bacterium]|jgi:type IV pilus assembly protein PilE|nr:prepilin-type N-terminal cleavage/methylation domain-containing protein [Saprospiraceae bacterium]